MKVRWRQYEFILVTIMAVFAAIRYLLHLVNAGVPFSEELAFYGEIVKAQFITLLMQYGCYIWLNRFVIAKLRTPKQQWQPVTNAMFKGEPVMAKIVLRIVAKYVWFALQFVIIIYLLGPVSNFVAYYYTQGFTDPGIANAVNSLFPAHPQPFFNTFGGFDITLFFVCLYLLYAAVREVAIYTIEKQDGRRQFRILITNQVGLFAVIYLSVFPVLILLSRPVNPVFMGQSTFVMYFFVVPATILVFIVNIYWLFPVKGQKPLLKSPVVGKLLLVTCICAVPVMFLQRAQMVGEGTFFFWGWMFQLFIVTPVSWLVYQQRKERILQVRGMETALTRSKADIQFLRSQINPHFLFNVLNTLYGTALQEGSERTAEGIQKLGDMMRFMLHDNNRDIIPMSREIDYLQNYISLQKLRIASSPNIVIHTHIAGEGCSHSIAPMLLIPFVENAFKHGISLVQPSYITISLSCDAGNIWFNVHNSMHPKQDSDTEEQRSGIGILNVVERLKIHYPGKHKLVFNGDGKEFMVTLHIQP